MSTLQISTPELVLVVEDEPAVRTLIESILSRAGYGVVGVGSGEEAIDFVSEGDAVTAVLTDINIDGRLSGLELIGALHALRPSLPIIPVSGAGDEANLREALDRGAAGFIAKPFTPAELRQKIAAALNRVSLVEGELQERLLAPTVASVLANAIEVRQEGMEGHTERLAALAVEIGRRVRLGASELELLGLGAVLHDVGKIGIPDRILLKPGPLDEEERAVMQLHAEIGDRMLAPLEMLASVRPIVRHHHERWDGAGYPDRLEGAAIPLLARIVAVADSVEAMSGPRSYRKSLSQTEIIRQLETGAGGQWEPGLVAIALELIEAERLRFVPTGMRLMETAA